MAATATATATTMGRPNSTRRRGLAVGILLALQGLASGFQSPLFAPVRRAPSLRTTRPPLPRRALSADPSPSSSSPGDGADASSLFQVIDRVGLSLKPKAYRASEKANLADSQTARLLYLVKTSLYYTLFILYRAYRGVFVILPAVFRQVYQKLETAVESPFEGGDATAATAARDEDVDPATGRVRWRTRITVSLLAGLVTLSYVLQGAVRVLVRFVKHLTRTSDVSGSFSAAALEQEANERDLVRMVKPDDHVNGLPANPEMLP